MNGKLSPMKMDPAFKDYIWGGERLINEYGKHTPMRPLAESWEISCHPDAPSKVSTGAYKGSTLVSVLTEHPEYIGKNYSGQFPILIKFIDAEQSLSLQVHPDNAYALEHEKQLGKNEMWYVIDAKPGAQLIVGFKEPVSSEEIRSRIEKNTLLEVANKVEVKAGDCFEIPAGMLHAIGEGIIIAEVQQSSNVTYRVYDYDRRDKKGNPRELHVEKAIDVIDSSLKAVNNSGNIVESLDGYSVKELTDWQWFKCYEYNIERTATLTASKDSFHSLMVLSGVVLVESSGGNIIIAKGESAFVPAGMGSYNLFGKARVIVITM